MSFRSRAAVELDESGTLLTIDVLSVPDAMTPLVGRHSTSRRSHDHSVPAPGEPDLDTDSGWLWIPITQAGRVRATVRGDATVTALHDGTQLIEISMTIQCDGEHSPR